MKPHSLSSDRRFTARKSRLLIPGKANATRLEAPESGHSVRGLDGPLLYILGTKHGCPYLSWAACHRRLVAYLANPACPVHGMWCLPSKSSMYRTLRQLPPAAKAPPADVSQSQWKG